MSRNLFMLFTSHVNNVNKLWNMGVPVTERTSLANKTTVKYLTQKYFSQKWLTQKYSIHKYFPHK